MASKNINILLSLKDQFTPKLKGTTKEIRAQQKQINAATKTINNWGKNANNVFKRVMSTAGRAAGVLATLGGAISVAGVVNFANEAIEGFNAAEEAETKLEAVLGNVPSIMSQGADAARRAKDELVALTDQMEENGVVAGDVSVAGLQQLATFQLSQETLEKLAPGMADLIAQQKGLNATQSDAVSIGNMIGKVMNGQTSALSRAGIIMYQEQILKTGTEEQKAATLADVLAQNVGGVNKALAETDAGKVAVAQNLIGRSTDLIGEKLMNIKGQLADLLIQHMPHEERHTVFQQRKLLKVLYGGFIGNSEHLGGLIDHQLIPNVELILKIEVEGALCHAGGFDNIGDRGLCQPFVGEKLKC